MAALSGRVAIITGAGRGIGRAHALRFAAQGAKVVVNDLGGGADGTGSDATLATRVVEEIRATGGDAVANHDDVTTWDGARRLIETAVEAFGDLHVLVNNAGILRDRMLVNMSEEEWDAVIRVHLKGHFCTTRWAAVHWRQRSKEGGPVQASVINTSSASGLFGNPGQTNYGAAKMGIAAFTMIANRELARYGVRVNAIAPAARTRLTGQDDGATAPAAPGFDEMDPGNVSPFVAYLGTADCPIDGRVFLVWGGRIELFQPWAIVDTLVKDGQWTVEELAEQATRLAQFPFVLNNPFAYLSGDA
jgi:NAD(P)-dependent dehydrogenase (short-subunit alcohol dehydrogenase family)